MLITSLPDEVLVLISEYLPIPVEFSGLCINRPKLEHDALNIYTKDPDSTLHLNALHFLAFSSTCRKLRYLLLPIIFREACGVVQTRSKEKLFLAQLSQLGVWQSPILQQITIFEPRILENARNRDEQRGLFDFINPSTLPCLKRLILELSSLNLDRILFNGNRYQGNNFWKDWEIKITASVQLDLRSLSTSTKQDDFDTKKLILKKIDRLTIMLPPLSLRHNIISPGIQLLQHSISSLECLSLALPFEVYTRVYEDTRALVRDTILSLIINSSSTITCLNIENLSYSWDLSKIQKYHFKALKRLICKDTHLGLFSIFPSFSGSLVISSPSLNSFERLEIPQKLTALTSFTFKKQSELYRQFSRLFKPANFIKFFEKLQNQNPQLKDVSFASLSVAELHSLTPTFIRNMTVFQLDKIDWVISKNGTKTWPETVTKTQSLQDEALEMPINKLMAFLIGNCNYQPEKCSLERLKLPLNYHELISFKQLIKLAKVVPGLKEIEITLQWPRMIHSLSEENLMQRGSYLSSDSELEWCVVAPHESYPHPEKANYLDFLFIGMDKDLPVESFCLLGRQFESLAMDQLTRIYPGRYENLAWTQGDFLPSMVMIDLDRLRLLMNTQYETTNDISCL